MITVVMTATTVYLADHQSSFDEDGVDAGSCDYSVRSDAFELGSNESSEEDDSDYRIQSEALEIQSMIDGSSDVDIESDLDLDSDESVAGLESGENETSPLCESQPGRSILEASV